MGARTAAVALLLTWGLGAGAGPVQAQETAAPERDREADIGAQPSAGDATASAPRVDVSRLPVDPERLQRKLRQAVEREERDGATLRFRVDVVGIAPRIQIFTPEDNLVFGRPSHGAPTHREMLEVVTPREFRSPVISLGTISW